MIERICRIAIATFVVLVWGVMATAFWVPSAHAWDDDKPKPTTPPPGTPTQLSSTPTPAAEPDRYKDYFWAGTAAGSLGITALQKTEHPWFYTVGGGTALAAAVVSAQPGGFDGKDFRYAVGGLMVGATGTGLVFGKGFWGWQTSIKW